ncbi:MAG: TauD/TfdA family dioxygenase [Alphaproteobacteria bacterium]|nr:TauD/TfdA family dioxygenase [Alphaproteobacteria bacterium]
MTTIKPLAKTFVAEVTGLDLARGVDDATFAEITAAWAAHPVLVFPGQDIDTDAQQTFAARFGRLKTRARKATDQGGAGCADNPYVMLVSNIKENGEYIGASPKGALPFHSDSAFDEVPAKASLLYGIETPKVGGDTLFISMVDVYNALGGPLKERIKDKWAVNYHLPSLPLDPNQSEAERMLTARRAAHPMVIAHPETGQPVLFVNRHMTRRIVGMAQDEADALLEEIYAIIEDPKNIHAHKWRKGGLVVWDNRCVQHGRSDFDPAERRLLRRFAIACDARPKAYSALCGDPPEIMAPAAE